MHARCALVSPRASTGMVAILACRLQSRVADVADEERVVALARPRSGRFRDFAGLEVVEVMELRRSFPDLRDAVHVDLRAGILTAASMRRRALL